MSRPKITDYLTITDAAKKVHELCGVTRTKEAVYHWVRYGKKDRFNRAIKLRVTKRLGQKFTTVEWLEKFIKEVG